MKPSKVHVLTVVTVPLPGCGRRKHLTFEAILKVDERVLPIFQPGHEFGFEVPGEEFYLYCTITKTRSQFDENNQHDSNQQPIDFIAKATMDGQRLKTLEGCKEFFKNLRAAKNVQLIQCYPRILM